MNHKRLALASLSSAALLACLSLLPAARAGAQQQQHSGEQHSEAKKKKHGFGVEEFDKFHDVLHPLQHEALPKNDLQTIRAKSADLVGSGHALAKLGTPQGVTKTTDYEDGLKKFKEALDAYEKDAKSGSDEQLRTSYIAVHDTFEGLVDLLPRKVQH
ncbi:MAG: hypothetical protein ACRD9R_16500 [Pyrinomonadaceae bacterium]